MTTEKLTDDECLTAFQQLAGCKECGGRGEVHIKSLESSLDEAKKAHERAVEAWASMAGQLSAMTAAVMEQTERDTLQSAPTIQAFAVMEPDGKVIRNTASENEHGATYHFGCSLNTFTTLYVSRGYRIVELEIKVKETK